MLPFVGQEVNGARIWIRIPGLGQFQPGEFAKLFLAFFFAAYLFDHRDQLAVGGKKMLGLQLPRIKDLGPIIVVWIASMGVLIMQHDLGTSLMFFAMFVAMLYTATGRKSWIIIGLIAFAAGAVLAAGMFSHVGQRVDAWLHPFSNEQYNKTPAAPGSWSPAFSAWHQAACSAPVSAKAILRSLRLRTPISSTPLWARNSV